MNTATSLCVLGHPGFPVTNTGPIQRSRTPALQPQNHGPTSCLASHVSLAGSSTRFTARRAGEPCGNHIRGLLSESQPWGLPSRRHRKDTMVTMLSTPRGHEVRCVLLPTSVPSLAPRRRGWKWGNASINPSPCKEQRHLLYETPSLIRVFLTELLGVSTCRTILSV